MRYRHAMRVSFGHADPARIAYYPRFFEWFHQAFESFFEHEFGEPYGDVLFGRNVGFPTVQVACEYLNAVRFGDLLTIEVFISALGSRSITFEYRVMRQGTLCATASVKVVTVAMDTFRPVEISDELRDFFSKFQETDAHFPDSSKIR